MKKLRGKFALVTGASRGIGLTIVRALASEGMNLVLSARDAAALEPIAAEARSHGAVVHMVASDLRKREDVEMLSARAEELSGGVAVLVNNAGIEGAAPFEEIAIERIEEMVAVNLVAPMTLTRLLLPHMIRRGEGHVVNIASLAGLAATPYEEPYSASKHGLVGFSRSLRVSLRAEGHDIGVSVLCPGFIAGAGMYHNASAATGATAPMMIGTVPVERIGKAVVRAIVADQPEVVLSGMPMLPFLMTQTLSPRMAGRMSVAIGVPAMFRKWARGAGGNS